MVRGLLTTALEQARGCDAVTATMASLHASRVLLTIDADAARRLFVDGVAAADSLAMPDRFKTLILEQAVELGARTHPRAAIDLFRRLPRQGIRSPFTGTMLVQALAEGGDLRSAVELLEDLTCDVGGAGSVMQTAPDLATKVRALRAARARWRWQRANHELLRARRGDDFYELLAWHWRVLGDEASPWLDEVLQAIASEPDRKQVSGYADGVILHSSRDIHLFAVLNMLRALRSDAEMSAILARHPDVAKAAVRFPLGLESVVTQPSPGPPEGASKEPGFCYVGSGSAREMALIPAMMAAHRGERTAIRVLLDAAHDELRADTDAAGGNLAPIVFWPSCAAYRRAFYWAGKIIGGDATALMGEVSQPELVALASIELAAGVAGLDAFSGVQVGPRR